MESKENYNPIFGQYPVGKEFTYMGVLMRVTKVEREDIQMISTNDSYMLGAQGIDCDYIAKDGHLNSKSFSVEELVSIAEEEELTPTESSIDIGDRLTKMIEEQEERGRRILRAIKSHDNKLTTKASQPKKEPIKDQRREI